MTSIEPEELKVDNSKHQGPKLLRKYLMYVRAVSKGDRLETAAILKDLNPTKTKEVIAITTVLSIETQIKERLEKLGYTVDVGLGNANSRISLAIYDKKSDRYLVGVELDKDAFENSLSSMERDVYKPRFLAERGWKILRIWSRDWWLSPNKVIKSIVGVAEKNKTK